MPGKFNDPFRFAPDDTFGERFDPFTVLRDVRERYTSRTRWAKGGMIKHTAGGKIQMCIMAAVLESMLERIKGSNVEEGNFSVFGGQSGSERKASPVVTEALFDALLTKTNWRNRVGVSPNLDAADLKHSVSHETKVDYLIRFNDHQSTTFEQIQELVDIAIALVKCDEADGCTTTC